MERQVRAARVRKGLESPRLLSTLISIALVVLTALTLATALVLSEQTAAAGRLFAGALLAVLLLFIFVVHRYHRASSAELRRSEERFRSTFEQAAVGLAHVSLTGRFLRINERFCEIAAYSRDEMQALTFQDITHPDDLDADLEHVRRLLRGESRTYSMEKRYLRKDSEAVWVNLTVSLLRDDAGAPRWFVAVVEDITERKQAEAQVRAYQQRLRALASDLTLTEERERRRVAEELHDGAVQGLASARMRLGVVSRRREAGGQAEVLDEVSQLLRQTALEVNQIASDLKSPSLSELGLMPAISDWMKQQVDRRFGIETELVDQREVDDREDPEYVVRALLFRSARELLANAVQHSHGTKIDVAVRRVGDHLELTVRDDGRGCTVSEALEGGEGEIGLFAIRERMTDLGGALRIETAPGMGFSATLVVPSPPRAPAIEWAGRETA